MKKTLIKKLKTISIVVVLGIITITVISYFTLPILSITTTPKESSVFINDHFYAKSPYKTRLKKGSYQIKISKEDYLDHVETINLNQNIGLKISLQPNQAVETIDTSISHALIKSIGSTQNNILISIDRNNSQLIKTDNSKITTIHAEPVKTFDYNYPIIALVEKNQPDRVILLNIETNEKKKITPKERTFISNVTISPNSGDTFVLGNIDTIGRTNGLYKILNEDESVIKLTDTKATTIKALSSQYLVEFAYADHNNASITSVLDTSNNERIFSAPGNSFSISSDNKTVAVFNSEKIITFSIDSKLSSELKLTKSYSARWLNNNTILLLSNYSDGILFSILNTKTNKITKFEKIGSLEGIHIKSINGVTKDDVYFTSIDGKLHNIPKAVFE